GRQCVGGGLQVGQSALGGFAVPLLRVAVAVENHRTVQLHYFLQHFLNSDVEIGCAFKTTGDVVERVAHDRIQRDQRSGDRLVRTDGAELEAVAGESERTGAVAVAGILVEFGERIYADVEHAFRTRVGGTTASDLLE